MTASSPDLAGFPAPTPASAASGPLPRSTPESRGLPSGALLDLLDHLDTADLEPHSLMVLQGGAVIAEGWWAPYAADSVHLLYSLSKSFTAAAVGLAEAEGRLRLTDRIVDLVPHRVPERPAHWADSATVRDLLAMASGHHSDQINTVAAVEDWVRGFLATEAESEPGTYFAYNQPCTYTLAAVLAELTGQRLTHYLRPRLFDPLGIDDAYWTASPAGVDLGYSGLHLTTESVAKLGQLYLRRGRWGDAQLLPADWVAEATRPQVSTLPFNEDSPPDWRQGYGFQFWMARHGYRGDGAYGQFCVVLPEQDVVVAATSATADMQGVLDRLWTHLLPAFTEPLPEDPAAHARLTERLANLRLPPVTGGPEPVIATGTPTWFGAGDGDGDGVWLEQRTTEDAHWDLSITLGPDTYRLPCGWREWAGTVLDLGHGAYLPVHTSGAWIAPDRFQGDVLFSQTPHRLRLTLSATGPDAGTVDWAWPTVPLTAANLRHLVAPGWRP